jgi:hypothetical protein
MHDDVFVNFRNGPPWDGLLWLTNPTVTARTYVMMAMGMVTVATGLTLDDALAALVARAYAVDRSWTRSPGTSSTGTYRPPAWPISDGGGQSPRQVMRHAAPRLCCRLLSR